MPLSAALVWITALSLALGVLPSFTALSQRLAQDLPALFKYLGPINFLKLGLPFVGVYFWRQRLQLPLRLRQLLAVSLILGSLATLISASLCHYPPTLLREWFVMVVGVLSACSFILLPARQRGLVLGAWAFFVYTAVFLDLTFPDSIDWLYAHVFDPDTRATDVIANGHRLLTGVYGSQSLAKILSWLPWILLAFSPKIQTRRRSFIGWVLLAALSTGIILKTSQRGPFLGMLFAWVCYGGHRLIRLGDRRSAAWAGIAICVAISLTLAVIPTESLKARWVSAFGDDNVANQEQHTAYLNVDFRKRSFWFTLDVIGNAPFGNACVPDADYFKVYIYPSHSHNLVLQQFKDRGWVWGLFHLALWLMALLFAWRSLAPEASAIFAATSGILFQGMFDHPWFVLVHAMLLGVVLVAGLTLGAPGRRGLKPGELL